MAILRLKVKTNDRVWLRMATIGEEATVIKFGELRKRAGQRAYQERVAEEWINVQERKMGGVHKEWADFISRVVGCMRSSEAETIKGTKTSEIV